MKFRIIEAEVDVGVQDPFETVAPDALQAFEANFGDADQFDVTLNKETGDLFATMPHGWMIWVSSTT